MERVYYVVGVAGGGTQADAFADLLAGDRPRSLRHYDKDKPFRAMSDKRIMYVERVGSGVGKVGMKLNMRATARAEQVMALHGDLDMEITPKRRKRK